MDEVVIRIKDLKASFDKKEVLRGISMDIYRNSITAIIGPSGCGKSTFIRCLNRINDLVEGFTFSGEIIYSEHGREIRIHEKDVNLIELRRRVGMVFQKPNPFPKSVYENVAFGLRIAGVKERGVLDRAVEKSLRDAALWDEVKDRLGQNALALSGGQQQRLCIARALAVEPRVLLLDEPCSAIDPISTAKIEELLFQLKRSYTIVIVTHNMQQAARVSDMTAFVLTGELIEYDTSVNLFRSPKDKRTEDYITGRFG